MSPRTLRSVRPIEGGVGSPLKLDGGGTPSMFRPPIHTFIDSVSVPIPLKTGTRNLFNEMVRMVKDTTVGPVPGQGAPSCHSSPEGPHVQLRLPDENSVIPHLLDPGRGRTPHSLGLRTSSAVGSTHWDQGTALETQTCFTPVLSSNRLYCRFRALVRFS